MGNSCAKSMITVDRNGQYDEVLKLVKHKANLNAVAEEHQANVLHILAEKRRRTGKSVRTLFPSPRGGGGGGQVQWLRGVCNDTGKPGKNCSLQGAGVGWVGWGSSGPLLTL